MKIEILQPVCIDGLHYKAGQVVDAKSIHFGTLPNMIRLGQAREIPEPLPEPETKPKRLKNS